jgi:thiol:disulfide interchange protein DsbD
MKRLFFSLSLIISFLTLSSHVLAFKTGGHEKMPFKVSYDEGPHQLVEGEKFNFTVRFKIPENYYLYDENFQINLEDQNFLKVGELIKPFGKVKFDPYLKKNVDVHFNEVVLDLEMEPIVDNLKSSQTLKGEIVFKGCSETLCYRAMKVPLEVEFRSNNAANSSNAINGTDSISWFDQLKAFLDKPDFDELIANSFFLAIIVSFIGGFLTGFTPCVLPMIPVTLAVIGVRKNQSIGKNFLASLVLVLGMAVMYSILGVIAGLIGESLGFLFKSPFFLIAIVILLALMSLSLLGLFQIQLPARIQTKIAMVSAEGYRGIFFIGLTLGLMAAPCVGPVVAPLLVLVAKTQDVVIGLVLLLSYALGMGIIFLVLGSLQGFMQVKLKAGGWTDWLKKGLGVLMLIVTIFYGQIVYSQIFNDQTTKKVDSIWYGNLTDGMNEAKRLNRPVVIDFYAEWCLPCVELDHQVWEKEEIINHLKANWVAIKIDCTKDTEACEEAVDQYDVIGWPTVIFLDQDHKWRKDLTLEGVVISAPEMKEILLKVENNK